MDSEEFKPMLELINVPSDLPDQLKDDCLHYIEKRFSDVMSGCLCGNGTIKASINHVEVVNKKVIAKIEFVHEEINLTARLNEIIL